MYGGSYSTTVELPELCREDVKRIQERIEELNIDEVPAAVEPSCIKHVLLAGATSFVGQFLLLALLEKRPGLAVTCILPEDNGSTSMQESVIWPHVERFVKDGSVRLVSGSLTKSQGGIASSLWDELGNDVDAVLLFSDDDDKVLGNYQNIRECHIQVLLSVLEFCMTKRLKHLGYASSMNIFPAYTARFGGKYGCAPLPDSPSIQDILELCPLDVMGYIWSKLVGEMGTSAAARRGVPTYIYRLPSVGACSSHIGFGCCNENEVFIRIRSAIQQVQLFPIEFCEAQAGFEEPADVVATIVANNLLERSTQQQSVWTELVFSCPPPVVFNCVRPDDVAALHSIMEQPMAPRADSYTTILLTGFNPTVCTWKEFKAECVKLGKKSPLHGYWTLIDRMESFWFANEGKSNGARPHINITSCGEVLWPHPQYVATLASVWQQMMSTSRWKLPVFTPKLDVEDLLSTVATLTGTSQKDLLDKPAEEALRRLLNCINTEANLKGNLKGGGRWLCRSQLQSFMDNSAYLTSSTTAKNNVKPRQDPIIICGFHRTGTTLLHRLMANDQQFKTMSAPEMLQLRYPDYIYPRCIGEVFRYTHLAKSHQGHQSAPTVPEEDVFILQGCFRCLSLSALGNYTSFADWLLEEGEMTPAYEFHAKVLALKEAESDSNHRWLLKMPYHTFFLPEVMHQYPKVSFIWIHRDIEEVVPSYIELLHGIHKIWRDTLTEEEKKTVAWRCLHDYKQMIRRSLKFRAENKDVKFADISYKRLVGDPLATVKDIYNQLNLDLSPEAEQSIAAAGDRLSADWKSYQSEMCNDEQVPKSLLKDFGLTTGDVERVFADYYAKFGNYITPDH